MNYYKKIEILQYFVEARLRRDADVPLSCCICETNPNMHCIKSSVGVNTTFTISDILHKFYENYRNEDWAVQEVKKFLNELTNFGVLFKIPNFGPRGGFGYSFNKASIDVFKVLVPAEISIVAKKIASQIINRIYDDYINPPVKAFYKAQQTKTQIKVCRCNKCGAFKKKKLRCKKCLNIKYLASISYMIKR